MAGAGAYFSARGGSAVNSERPKSGEMVELSASNNVV